MKKSQLNRVLPAVIFFAIILIVIIVIQTDIFAPVEGRQDITSCITSVKFSKALTGAGFEELPLECYTSDLIITEDLATEEGQTSAKRDIGESMVECWSKFDQGQTHLIQKSGSFCNFCTVVQFSAENSNKKITGLPNFLSTTKRENGPEKYMDYLMQTEVGDAKKFIDSSQEITRDQIQTDIMGKNTYSIIFHQAKGQEAIAEFKAFLGGGSRTTGAAIIGAGVSSLAGGVAAILLLSNPVSATGVAVIGLFALVGGGFTGVREAFFVNNDNAILSTIMFSDFTEAELTQINCQSVK